MAKAQVSPFLARLLSGPTASVKFRHLAPGLSLAQPRPQRTKNKLPVVPLNEVPALIPFDQPVNSAPIEPPFHRIDCQAWKDADAFYTAKFPDLANLYRRAMHAKCKSPYDGWMKQAMPHLIRGLYKTPWPRPTVGFKLLDLEQFPPLQEPFFTVSACCAIEPRYNAHGCYYAIARAAEVYYDGPDPTPQPPPPPPIKFHLDYETRFYCESFCHYNDLPRVAWIEYSIYQHPDAPYPFWTSEWIDNFPAITHLAVSEELPVAVSFRYREPRTDDHRHVIPGLPPENFGFRAKFLTWHNYFRTCPQILKQKRGFHTGTLDPWEPYVTRRVYIWNGIPLDPHYVFYRPL